MDCENWRDESNCTAAATERMVRNQLQKTLSHQTSGGDHIYVSEGAIWTLGISITIVFVLVSLIMWLKFKSAKSASRFTFSAQYRACSSSQQRLASIDRMRRRENQNIERPESYHYNSRPSSMIYIGSQDNVRSISSQLSWYSQQIIQGPLRLEDATPCLITTSIEHVIDADADSTVSVESQEAGLGDRTPQVGEPALTPTSPPPQYDRCNPSGDAAPPTYIECNQDGTDGASQRATAAVETTTPPPTYSDSLSYNFITYV